ncbi:MAG: plasmid mobilization relaxosome protein MobC [Pseudomonadota bacterium]
MTPAAAERALRVEFSKADPKPKKSSSRMFSVRLSDEQWKELPRLAEGKPLGVYARAAMFGGDGHLKRRKQSKAVHDPEALAKALGLLGGSGISANLNQLAKAANVGVLPVTPETCAELNEACAHVREIRALLTKALGLRGRS